MPINSLEVPLFDFLYLSTPTEADSENLAAKTPSFQVLQSALCLNRIGKMAE